MLPIIPQQFKYEVTKDKVKQFAVIKNLLSNPQVTEVIHAGDAGEGRRINCQKYSPSNQCQTTDEKIMDLHTKIN